MDRKFPCVSMRNGHHGYIIKRLFSTLFLRGLMHEIKMAYLIDIFNVSHLEVTVTSHDILRMKIKR
jgi:hypothetical protein